MEQITGKVHKFSDNINTDEIIPAKFLNISGPAELGEHCMEGIDEQFPKKVSKGDVIVAGKNFGCGSSREHAPVSIKAAGVACVVAESFARIFFRNAINIGLPIVELKSGTGEISQGDILQVDFVSGTIINKTRNNEKYSIEPYPSFMQELIEQGGLINYLAQGKKPSGTPQNRRVARRVDMDLECDIYDASGTKFIDRGRVLDLSIGGIKMQTLKQFDISDVISIKFILQKQDSIAVIGMAIKGEVEIVYKFSEGSHVFCGLRFLKLSNVDKQRISEFIEYRSK